VFVAFECLRAPSGTAGPGSKNVFIRARGKPISELQGEIHAAVAGIGGTTLKCHKDKSLLPPRWGLLEEHPGGRGGGIEGVVAGIGSNSRDGIVLEFEHRRKSGRGVQEWFYLPLGAALTLKDTTNAKAGTPLFEKVGVQPGLLEKLILLEDHPKWRSSEQVNLYGSEGNNEGDILQSTFDLGLTEKQKKARDEVVLPYFDAQDEMGLSGGGGRILYMPGKDTDDWDDEEDEV